jgi:multidrug efflux pump
VLLGTIALSVWLYISIPKTFFPEQDTGVLMGGIQADQSISSRRCAASCRTL